jgi:hypothetical protein
MTHCVLSSDSCEAGVLIGHESSIDGKVASIQHIESKEQGKGHAKGCIKLIEQVARSHKCKEIWFPTIIHPALTHILANQGYEFANFGPHPMMPDAGDVTGYKKVLK